MKKLLIFDFNKKKYFKLCKEKKAPCNSVYGLNYIDKKKFIVDFISDYSLTRFKFFNNILYFFALFKNDIIFSTQYLGFLYFKIFIPNKTKWVLFNINFSTILKNNEKNKIKYFLIKNAIKKADKIICLSNVQVNDLIRIGVKREKIELILFGVDNDFYNYTKNDEGYILSVGKDGGRDFESVINVAKKLNEKVIIITSKNSFSIFKKIQKNVKIIYDVDYLELRNYYQGAKIVVVSSKDEKKYIKHKFGSSDCSGQTVILDAMACGKQVIASKREWMDDYDLNILLYKAENEDDLIKKIKQAINIETNENTRLLSRKIIDEKLNIKNFGKSLGNIFKKI